MRVRMLKQAAGPDGVWPAGSIQDVAPFMAVALIEGGYAQAVETPESPVVIETPEAGTAATRRTKRAATKNNSEGA